MGIDILTLALARKYTNEALNGAGALKGSACTIESIVDDGAGNLVTFAWIGADGTKQTSTMYVKHGVGADELQTALEQAEAAVAAAVEASARADAAAERAEAAGGEDGQAITF